MDSAETYDQKAAQRIFELISIGTEMELRDGGVYLSDGFVAASLWGGGAVLAWVPQCALLDADPQDSLLLPLPFSAQDLAALFLCPVLKGSLGLDELKGRLSGTQDGLVLRAVEEADQALQLAQKSVDSPEDAQREEAVRIEAERLEAEYRDKRDRARQCREMLDAQDKDAGADTHALRLDLTNAEVAANALWSASQDARRRVDSAEVDRLNRVTRALYGRPQILVSDLDQEDGEFWLLVGWLRASVGDGAWKAWERMASVDYPRAVWLVSGVDPENPLGRSIDAKVEQHLKNTNADGKKRTLLEWVWVWFSLQRSAAQSVQGGDAAAQLRSEGTQATQEPAPAQAGGAPAAVASQVRDDVPAGNHEGQAIEGSPSNRNGGSLWSLVFDYILSRFRTINPGSAKNLYQVLFEEAGKNPESPFEKGSGANRGALVVRGRNKKLALKTLQNNWSTLRQAASKGA
ncbi:hypothetical protein [Shinella sp.]|uniref:hypothetical protein n=1 Tax=Shinella sp. TaxID=1870904 RepID=UPI0039E31D1C